MARKATEIRVPKDWDELFPGRFLKAIDLPGRITVQITKVYQEKIDGKWRLILQMKGAEKELAVNRTNGESLKAMFGRKVQEWVGKRITLAAENVRAFGETVSAVRVVGSPDIAEPVEVDVDLGRVAIKRTLRPTPKNGTPSTSRTGGQGGA